MSSKVFRDPLYNYVSIDLSSDRWLVDVVNSREFQRLRRIHQLGVSHFTYPGADHNRLCHSLGVLHLMQLAFDHLSQDHKERHLEIARPVLFAAALAHDVGHGPFSHLFEPCLGIDHEEWSQKIILDPETDLNRCLRMCDTGLPQSVADLINPKNESRPAWQKTLISSQIDMDRLDYLRRDSLFTGAGYGHFDWHRIITTMEIQGDKPSDWEITWSDKAKLAIEEYIFARSYMYQNVYLHKTTRGFEQMIQVMWKRARDLHNDNSDVSIVPTIERFWDAKEPTSQQYLDIEEYTVMSQIQAWRDHADAGLSDLAARFLDRKPFSMIEEPDAKLKLAEGPSEWERALKELVEKHTEFSPSWMYCLIDAVKPKYHQPYFPEKESGEQTVKNAIRIKNGAQSTEISELLPRLRPLTEPPPIKKRYYVPGELRDDALKLRSQFAP